jgi:hypothetical protein
MRMGDGPARDDEGVNLTFNSPFSILLFSQQIHQ